jgi:hypothetical protein
MLLFLPAKRPHSQDNHDNPEAGHYQQVLVSHADSSELFWYDVVGPSAVSTRNLASASFKLALFIFRVLTILQG